MLQKIIDAPRKIQDIPKAVTKDFYCNLVRIRCNFRQNLKTAFIPFEKIHIPNSRKKAVYQSRKFACHSRKFVYSIKFHITNSRKNIHCLDLIRNLWGVGGWLWYFKWHQRAIHYYPANLHFHFIVQYTTTRGRTPHCTGHYWRTDRTKPAASKTDQGLIEIARKTRQARPTSNICRNSKNSGPSSNEMIKPNKGKPVSLGFLFLRLNRSTSELIAA